MQYFDFYSTSSPSSSSSSRILFFLIVDDTFAVVDCDADAGADAGAGAIFLIAALTVALPPDFTAEPKAHRIPAWYDEKNNIYVAKNKKEALLLAKKKISEKNIY